MLLTISAPSPVWPKPSSLVLPRSLSKAATCLLSSLAWAWAYCAAPSISLPDSSPLQAMNRRVLLALYPLSFNSLKASNTEMKPPPSSLAPVWLPVSQESICPPASTIWSGQVLPTISKIRLLEQVLGTNWLCRLRLILIVCPLSCILWNIYESYTVMAPHGILGYLLSYYMYPVCTEYTLSEATERTSIALAPYWAALDAPSTRYSTELLQSTQGLLNTTILPATLSFNCYNSSQFLATTTSAVTFPLTEPPKPITLSGVGLGLGSNNVRDSSPLTHLVKFLTCSSLTFSKPALDAILASSQMACSNAMDPHIRGPQVSVRQASRSQAACFHGACLILLLRSTTKSVQSFSVLTASTASSKDNNRRFLIKYNKQQTSLSHY